MAQMVKNLPSMQETQIQCQCQEDTLEKNAYPLQYSCLDNSMDRGDWWATVHGFAKSWTLLGPCGAWWAAVHGVARVRHDLETKQSYEEEN